MKPTNQIMLRDDIINEPSEIKSLDPNEYVFYVGHDSIMKNAVDLIPHFGKSEKIVLKAKGNSIPNAVAIANILTEKMLKGSSKIQKIIVDSEAILEMGRMTSTIEIVISKN